ncbi:29147_t:CDS:2, partial [Gigaspora margarita]
TTTCSAGKTKAQCCGELEEACGDGECCPRVMLFFQISIPCLQA